MSHKEEAERGLRDVERMDVSENVRVLSGEHKADQIAIAQLKATLALVDAVEADHKIPEALRLVKDLESQALNSLKNGRGLLGAPTILEYCVHITAALGIGEDQ